MDQTIETGEFVAHSQAASGNGIPLSEIWWVARRRLGWSIDFAAREIGVSTLHLDYLESGIRTPGPELMDRMAAAYGVEVDRLEARVRNERIPPRYDSDTGTVWLGWLPVVTKGFDNGQILNAVAATIRTMRSLEDDQPVFLRDADLEILAPLLDFEDRQLGQRLATFLRLADEEVEELVERMEQAVR